MQSGRIAPIFRQFFSGQIQPQRSHDSHKDGSNPQGQQEREPTREEAMAALEILLQQDEFKKQGLSGELKLLDGRWSILVCDRAGLQLKMIRGTDLLRVLGHAAAGREGPSLGRILDRRV